MLFGAAEGASARLLGCLPVGSCCWLLLSTTAASADVETAWAFVPAPRAAAGAAECGVLSSPSGAAAD